MLAQHPDSPPLQPFGGFIPEPSVDPASSIAEYRAALKAWDEQLQSCFEQGVPARDLVPARARSMDYLLSQVWQRFFSSGGDELSLVAVGGYGRGELHPGSDVDIMLLAAEGAIDRHRDALERWLAFLWDLGLEVGHSVRTLADCAREAAADVTVATNIMEARLLQGNAKLFHEMRRITAPDQVWSSRAFFAAKRDEQQRRYQKYHETAYNLEPNVKEGPGGLRDLQTIGWVAKRHFGAETLHDLVSHGFLTEAEHQLLSDCQDFLWQVRFALHVFNGRREDRLLFDYQRQVAQHFGFHDQGFNLAIEQFMQQYYRTIMELSRLNEMLLQLFEEAILLADHPGKPVPVNRRFQIRRGFLEVTRENVFRRYPYALLEIFLILAQHPEIKGVRAATVRLIRAHRPLIDNRFRNDVRARSLFMEILRQPVGVTHQLRRMNRYGVLASYLPEFAQIVGRMQYDLFHVYTVDEHILFAVRNLRRFYVPRFAHEFPHCSELIHRVPKPELLYIAALYHDIGKGRGGDHSRLGAEDAELFCRRHGLSDFDTQLVRWLVEHHLLMSLTAQKKDIHDPGVVAEFAHQMGSVTRLNYLYLLTVADIRATNPRLWNAWRESLLRQLHRAAQRILLRGLDNPLDRQERIDETRQQAAAILRQRGISEPRIQRAWDSFSEDYFLRHSVDEVVWHTRAVLKKADDGRVMVLARDYHQRGGTELFFYLRDRDKLFAQITSVLDQLELTVLDARIITSPCGLVLNSFTVVEESGTPIAERRRIKTIAHCLRQQLNCPDTVPGVARRRTPRLLRHFQAPTRVSFSDDESNQRTIMELSSTDRPGLLCRVGRAFLECGVRVQNAKIATIGARAEDLFFITDEQNQPLREARQFVALREALVRHLDDSIG